MATPIAVLDDDPGFLTFMQDLLSVVGYAPHTVQAGPAALPCLRTLGPACIILDPWPMPVEQALDLLARDATLATTPVLVSSTNWRELERTRGRLCGRGYGSIRKPFAIDDFLALLGRLVGAPAPVLSRHEDVAVA